ncbi:MAG: DUF6279 family lipoprotein [Usitatibacter sp.]
MIPASLARAALVAAWALLAASCSLTKLAYSNMPFAYGKAMPALAWMVGDYVDLSHEQKDWVRARLAQTFAWHRSQELPEYRHFLERMLERSADGLSAGEAREAYRELRVYYDRTIERVIPDIADFLLHLDPLQVAQLEHKFASDNEKLVRDSVKGSAEDRREKRAERFIDTIEEFVGPLSGAQRDLVSRHVGALDDLTGERLGDRRYRQAETLAMIRANVPREVMLAGLRRLLVDTASWRRPEFQRKLHERDERVFEMAAALSDTLTSRQRTHLRERLRGFIHDIAELTASS